MSDRWYSLLLLWWSNIYALYERLRASVMRYAK
jgi:hypothetical protein